MQVVQERSLDWLCRKVLKRRLPKESKLRCGDWEAATLSSEQVAYAALDAAVSLQLHTAMAAMREIHLPQCDDGNDDEGWEQSMGVVMKSCCWSAEVHECCELLSMWCCINWRDFIVWLVVVLFVVCLFVYVMLFVYQ
jgi:hypothetical protein